MSAQRRWQWLAGVLLAIAVAMDANAALVIIVNNDGAGTGFNDPTAKTPEGGNPGTTLGAQRLYLFQAAAREWSALLKSNVTIRVGATFIPLSPCGGGSGVLGSAGPTTFMTLVPTPSGAHASTFYAQALAEALLNVDKNSGAADITAQFNSSVDSGCVSSGTRFWYGVNPAVAVPNGTFALFPTVLHELGHGLGFLTLVCTSSGGCGSGSPQGALANGIPDIWTYFLASASNTGLLWKDMTNAQRAASITSDPSLVWLGANVTADLATFAPTSAGTNGGHMRLYAPATVEPGSSVSHYTKDAANPNLLMEPVLQSGVFNNTDLTYSLLKDTGWATRPRDTIFADGLDSQ